MVTLVFQKRQARTTFRKRRDGLTEGQRLSAAKEVARIGPDALRRAGFLPPVGSLIAVYIAFRSEMDPLPLVQALRGLGFRLLAPVVVGQNQPLVFCAWDEDTRVAVGLYGMLEPMVSPVGVSTDASATGRIPDLILAPLLAYDRKGTRLGYGGGFYDRTRALYSHKPPCVGLAFACQEVPEGLPEEAHDQPLDGVLTEKGLQRLPDPV